MHKLTSPNGRYETVLQDDGNLVTYRSGVPIWASGGDDTPQPPTPPTPPPDARAGRVRLENRVMRDDRGPFLALGHSLFWLVRDARETNGDANARWLSEHGAGCVRVLSETTDWPEQMRTDPRLPDYVERLHATRDLARRYNMRIHWTIFGGNALTVSEQEHTVARVLEVCDASPELVQSVEVSNEGQGFSDAQGEARMRAFGAMFAQRGYVTALTSAAHSDATLYPDSRATVATEHFERAMTEGGWRPVRQPWGYWEHSDFPPTFVNNEPVGIQSSVAMDDDPLRLACGAIVTWLVGGCLHVVHSAAGIYGVPMTHPTAGYRPPNVWDHPTLEPTLNAIAHMRTLLPPDLPNWTRQNHHWPGHPFTFSPFEPGDASLAANHGCTRAYAATRGNQVVCLPIGVMRDITLTPKQAMNWATYDVLTGERRLQGNGPLTLTTTQLVVGTL